MYLHVWNKVKIFFFYSFQTTICTSRDIAGVFCCLQNSSPLAHQCVRTLYCGRTVHGGLERPRSLVQLPTPLLSCASIPWCIYLVRYPQAISWLTKQIIDTHLLYYSLAMKDSPGHFCSTCWWALLNPSLGSSVLAYRRTCHRESEAGITVLGSLILHWECILEPQSLRISFCLFLLKFSEMKWLHLRLACMLMCHPTAMWRRV